MCPHSIPPALSTFQLLCVYGEPNAICQFDLIVLVHGYDQNKRTAAITRLAQILQLT